MGRIPAESSSWERTQLGSRRPSALSSRQGVGLEKHLCTQLIDMAVGSAAPCPLVASSLALCWNWLDQVPCCRALQHLCAVECFLPCTFVLVEAPRSCATRFWISSYAGCATDYVGTMFLPERLLLQTRALLVHMGNVMSWTIISLCAHHQCGRMHITHQRAQRGAEGRSWCQRREQ